MAGVRFDNGSPYAPLRHEVAGEYVRVVKRGHALADQRGRVMAHRAVLYDAIGDGPHRCQWCHRDGLRWDVSRLDPSYLVVDHLDGDGRHNTLDNLVAAHGYCNSYRSTIERLNIPWETFTDVPPEDRPALYNPQTKAATKAAENLARSRPISPGAKPAPAEASERTPWDGLFTVPTALLEKYAFLAEVKP